MIMKLRRCRVLKHTVNFIIDIDDDMIYEAEELENMISDCLDTASITVKDFKVISIDD